jgi:hypothetical protein
VHRGISCQTTTYSAERSATESSAAPAPREHRSGGLHACVSSLSLSLSLSLAGIGKRQSDGGLLSLPLRCLQQVHGHTAYTQDNKIETEIRKRLEINKRRARGRGGKGPCVTQNNGKQQLPLRDHATPRELTNNLSSPHHLFPLTSSRGGGTCPSHTPDGEREREGERGFVSVRCASARQRCGPSRRSGQSAPVGR